MGPLVPTPVHDATRRDARCAGRSDRTARHRSPPANDGRARGHGRAPRALSRAPPRAPSSPPWPRSRRLNGPHSPRRVRSCRMTATAAANLPSVRAAWRRQSLISRMRASMPHRVGMPRRASAPPAAMQVLGQPPLDHYAAAAGSFRSRIEVVLTARASGWVQGRSRPPSRAAAQSRQRRSTLARAWGVSSCGACSRSWPQLDSIGTFSSLPLEPQSCKLLSVWPLSSSHRAHTPSKRL